MLDVILKSFENPWVVGNEPYVSLHFSGAEKYARKE